MNENSQINPILTASDVTAPNTPTSSSNPPSPLNDPFPNTELDIHKYINIVTHNAQGLTDSLKLQIWLEFCAKNNYHIIFITETKLKDSASASLTNPYYNIYTSNFIPKNKTQREASLGIAVALHKALQPYIHNIQTFPGTALCIDFHLPSNNKLHLISLYLPSNHPDQSTSTQNTIANWLLEARHKNWHTITLGDFNDNTKRCK